MIYSHFASLPIDEGPRQALGSTIEHRAPAAHPRAIDIFGLVVDEQDRLGHRHAHARLGVCEEDTLRLAHAQRSRIDDLVEMRAEARMVAQPGRAMMLLIGCREDAPAGALSPGVRLGQHRAIDDGILLEPVAHEVVDAVVHPLGAEIVLQRDVEVEPAAQDFAEFALEELPLYLFIVETEILLQRRVPWLRRPRLGERDDAVDIEDEDEAGTHVSLCYTTPMELVVPSLSQLDGYVDALKRGWSPDNERLEAAAREHLEMIEKDAAAFLARTQDREAKGGDIPMPDGSMVKRLPGFVRWMWDGEFCGQIGFRWQPGTEALPTYVIGHIGYAVVPWKRRRGYATRALGRMLAAARREGLAWVEL